MDEVGDHLANQIIGAVRRNSPETGGIYIDHAPIGVDTHGVGTVLEQSPESFFDRIEGQ